MEVLSRQIPPSAPTTSSPIPVRQQQSVLGWKETIASSPSWLFKKLNLLEKKPKEQESESFELYMQLPIELRLLPLHWLTVSQLAVASRVCREWNDYIRSCRRLWKGKFIPIEAYGGPPVRVCHAAVIHKDSLLVYGGHIPSDEDCIVKVRNDLWEYNILTHVWKRITTFDPVTEVTPVLWNSSMYIFGGFENSTRSSSIFEFNCEKKKFNRVPSPDSPPRSRSAYSAVLYKNSMYIFGGWDGIESMNDFHRFNLETNKWDELKGNGQVPPPVRSHTAVVYKDAMYLWGGYGQGKHLTDVYKYEFETDTWSQVETTGPKPSPRSRLRGIVYGNRMFVLGGYDRSAQGSKGLCKDNFELNLDTMHWKPLTLTGLPPGGVAQYTVNVYNDILFLFGGYDGKASNELYGMKLFNNQPSA